MINYWILKTEPEVYSFDQLVKDKKTNWNGVRNYQARNYIQTFKILDMAFIYHTGTERRIVGTAQITTEPYADIDTKKPGNWFQADLKPLAALNKPVSLEQLKTIAELKNLVLFKQGRLSVVPLSEKEFNLILSYGK